MEYICPHCKKPIYDDEALLCLYCGESLRRDIGFLSRVKSRRYRLVVFTIVGLTLLAFIILLVW